MARTAGALGERTQAVLDLARGQGRLITTMSGVACEQRITNLGVRSQITADPVEKARLLREASQCVDPPGWHSPHYSL
ncbi:hypothetical protein ABZ682_18245 [Streptomyces griseoviridis]|uniref:hypothetical protein n=1 Tax=Streptomyces griseoviridis TaxID=45398 RepID=UPI00340F4A01